MRCSFAIAAFALSTSCSQGAPCDDGGCSSPALPVDVVTADGRAFSAGAKFVVRVEHTGVDVGPHTYACAVPSTAQEQRCTGADGSLDAVFIDDRRIRMQVDLNGAQKSPVRITIDDGAGIELAAQSFTPRITTHATEQCFVCPTVESEHLTVP